VHQNLAIELDAERGLRGPFFISRFFQILRRSKFRKKLLTTRLKLSTGACCRSQFALSATAMSPMISEMGVYYNELRDLLVCEYRTTLTAVCTPTPLTSNGCPLWSITTGQEAQSARGKAR
jgi:hypothetical protein